MKTKYVCFYREGLRNRKSLGEDRGVDAHKMQKGTDGEGQQAEVSVRTATRPASGLRPSPFARVHLNIANENGVMSVFHPSWSNVNLGKDCRN